MVISLNVLMLIVNMQSFVPIPAVPAVQYPTTPEVVPGYSTCTYTISVRIHLLSCEYVRYVAVSRNACVAITICGTQCSAVYVFYCPCLPYPRLPEGDLARWSAMYRTALTCFRPPPPWRRLFEGCLAATDPETLEFHQPLTPMK